MLYWPAICDRFFLRSLYQNQPIIANLSEERIDKLTGIHPKSDLINSIVLGLESPIYAEGEGVISDGRLIGMGPEAYNVVGRE